MSALHPETIERVCAWLRAEVGVLEASGRNDGVRVEYYLALGKRGAKLAREPGLSWCMALALTAYCDQGCDFPGSDYALRRVSTAYEVARQHGAILGPDEEPEPGDWVLWLGRHAHASAGPSGHAETIVEVQRDNLFDHVETVTLVCVGGNVGNAVRLTNHRADDPRITAIVRPARLLSGGKQA